MKKWIIPIVLMMLLMPTAGATTTTNARVLFALDDGSYHWQQVRVDSALNASIKAANAEAIGFNYTNTTYGAYVDSIGGVSSPTDYTWWWELMIWNQTNSSWDESQVGASDLMLKNGDSIAWVQSNRAPPNETPKTNGLVPKPQEWRSSLLLMGVLIAGVVAVMVLVAVGVTRWLYRNETAQSRRK